jgi:kinesin family protein 3/17
MILAMFLSLSDSGGVSTSVQAVNTDDLEAEKAAIREKYEREIAQLKQSFTSEQQTSQGLLQQLQQLQAQYQQSLDSLASKTTSTSVSNQTSIASGSGVLPNDAGNVLSQLHELEGALVGGEATANLQLKQELDEKKRLAEERQMKVQEASEAIFFDDEILVKIYNSLTEEVSAKHTFAVRERDRRKAAEEDIKDLQAEFQEEREEYLETIRRQQQKMQLQEQLLSTIVPCLRRDCNYYNIDKVRSECRWNDEEEEWILPKLTLSRTEFKTVNNSVSSSALQITTSPHDSPRRVDRGSHTRRSVDNTGALLNDDFQDDDRQLLSHLSQPESSSYFKPKRAEVLLSGAHQSPIARSNGHGDSLSPNRSTGRLQPLKKSQDPLAILEQAERKIGHKKLQPISKFPP